jgi:hypothetical protein
MMVASETSWHCANFFLASTTKSATLFQVTTLKAHFDGKVLVPEEPVDLPLNCTLNVQVEAEKAPTAEKGEKTLAGLLELAKKFPATGPVDGAEQHDHYLYGVPKREKP